MPRINNLTTDTTIRDNDYLVGYDGQDGNSAKKFQIGDIKDHISETALEGYRDGHVLVSYKDEILESLMRQRMGDTVLLDGTGTEEDDSIVAISATQLQVGEAISSVVFANNISAGNYIVITNTSGDRDFGVIESVDSSANTITLDSDYQLDDYTNFVSSKGYANTVTLYVPVDVYINTNLVVQDDLTIHGSLLDEEGNSIVQTNPVTLSGDNTYTGVNTFNDNVTIFEEGIQIGTGSDRFEISDMSHSVGDILAIDSTNNAMEFTTVGELLTFGTNANEIAVWAEGNNSSKIPGNRVTQATSSTEGVVKPGTNLTITGDGTLNASGSVGTIAMQESGVAVTDGGAVTTLNLTGDAVTSVNASGSVATITLATGNVAIENDGTSITGIDTYNFQGAMSVAKDGTDTGDLNINVVDATTTVKGVASFNSDDFTVSSGAVSLASGLLKDDADNVFTGDNTFENASGGVINLKRLDTTPVSNDTIGLVQHEAYSLETTSYQVFGEVETEYKDNSDYEYGQFKVNTNYVTKSSDTFSSLTALTIDRYGMTASVGTTLNEDVTIGSSSSKTLTVNATASFEQPITGSITEVVNDRDNTQNLKIWRGTQEQYDDLDSYDDDTIYYTT